MKTNQRRWARVALFGCVTIIVAVPVASAQIVTIPNGLNPGDQYRLAFVTNGTTLATSTDIAAYNTFVTAEANTQPELVTLGATWAAIGSTPTDDARDNTGTNVTVRLWGPTVAG